MGDELTLSGSSKSLDVERLCLRLSFLCRSTVSALQFVQGNVGRNGESSRPDRGWPVWLRHGRGVFHECGRSPFRGRGRVFLPVLTASELVEILRKGRRFHLNAFLMKFFGYLLNVEAALFHPLQNRGQGENRLFHGHAAVAVESDFDGLQCGELGSNFLDLGCGDFHAVLLLYLWRGLSVNMTPDLSFAFPVERDGRPSFAK